MKIIATVANFRKVKNHILLLKGFRELLHELDEVRLMLIGQGYAHDPEGSEVEVRLGAPLNKTLKVRLPAGVDDGERIRLLGQGQPSPNGGPSGNLYITVQTRPHPTLRREGKDLYLDVPITVSEAVRGASIDVPVLSGQVKMKIPPGMTGGEKLRLKGKGVARAGNEPGDQFVVLTVKAPQRDKLDAPTLAAIDRIYGDVRSGLTS